MADPLQWKEGGGYDVHVLRGGPASSPLDVQLDLTQNPTPAPTFTPHLQPAPNNQGITVNPTTGRVTAAAHRASPQPKFLNFNFLMTVSQVVPGVGTFETLVRVHVHDVVQKIWLTPNTLTVHTHADECKFTVLALFDDGTVGDITDWPQVTLTSSDPSSVSILPGDIVTAEPGRPDTEMEVPVTAKLDLTQPQISLSATAKAATRNNWTSLAEREAQLRFVSGPRTPNINDPGSSKPDSVASVVAARTNILFVSEGFPSTQQKDYDKAVDELVKSGLSQSILEPFKLLQNSINYWSVFVRSQEDGISLLGEYEVLKKGTAQRGTPVPYPAAPLAGATSWSVDNMIHEVGLPLPNSPTRTAAEWVTHWSKIYPATATVALVQPVLSDWVSLQNRTTLNERDSVFGFAHRVRTRVSDGAEGDPLLRPAFRRPTEASIDKFIEKLVYGNPQPGGDPYNIGETWANTQKDRDLVCFVCLSDIGAGEARAGYFAATTGYERLVELQNGANGKDILTSALSNTKAPFSAGIFASRVAHECGHAFGLGDEYGPGSGSLFVMGSSGIPIFRNTQVKDIIVSAPVPPATLPVYDTRLIKWLLPRTTKTATLAKIPGALGGRDFEFWLTPGQGTQFAVGDLVQVRKAPMRNSDPYINLRFKVAQKFPDKLEVTQTVGQNLDPLDYDPSVAYVVNCVNQMQGSELKLIADPVLAHIASSASPLNAPPGATGAACVAVQNASPVMTPTNLPAMTFNRKRPAALADIIGVYEGAAHFDCGVFRPAGRCKMRSTNDDKVPFCHVCRYIIVDRVDATRLAQLDVMYDPHYPI